MNQNPNRKPKKRSEKQREASRRNGAKSQGPVTAAGKAISSRNHTTHGLCACKNLLLNNENPHNLDLLHQTYLQRFQPADPVELDLVEQIVAAQWRVRRYTAVETALLDETMRRHIDELPPPSYEGERCGRAFADLADNANSLALAGRYQARNSREYYRAMKTLLELRREIPVPPGSSPLPPATPPPRPGVHFPARHKPEPVAAESPAAGQPTQPAAPTATSRILPLAALFTLILLALLLPAMAAAPNIKLPFEPETPISRLVLISCQGPAAASTGPDTREPLSPGVSASWRENFDGAASTPAAPRSQPVPSGPPALTPLSLPLVYP